MWIAVDNGEQRPPLRDVAGPPRRAPRGCGAARRGASGRGCRRTPRPPCPARPSEAAALWGLTMTFGQIQKGLSGGSGSAVNTSRKAPARWPDRRAASRSASTATPPRETFTRCAPGGSRASAFASIRPLVVVGERAGEDQPVGARQPFGQMGEVGRPRRSRAGRRPPRSAGRRPCGGRGRGRGGRSPGRSGRCRPPARSGRRGRAARPLRGRAGAIRGGAAPR